MSSRTNNFYKPGQPLTEMQLRVVGMVARGLINKVIAHRLGVDESIIKAHVSASLTRTASTGRVQLTLWYLSQQNDESLRRFLREYAPRVEPAEPKPSCQ